MSTQLSPAQATALAADINARPAVLGAWASNADWYSIMTWYNSTAQTGDFANPLTIWLPNMTIAQLNSAIDWTADPLGAGATTDAQKTNLWLKWQSMCWNNVIDMTDQQVRQGVTSVWGTGSATDSAIKAAGKRTGTRAEVLFSTAAVGGSHVSQFFGRSLTPEDVQHAMGA